MKKSPRRTLHAVFGSFSSIRGRLSVVSLVTTGIALLTMTLALLQRDLSEYREALATDLSTDAAMLGALTGVAMDFDDQPRAESNLTAISAKPAVLAAALYSVDGTLYAQYKVASARPLPPRLDMPSEGERISRNRMEVTRSVVQNGQQVGVVYVRGVYDVWGHVNAYAGILASIMLLSMAVALALAAGLRRRIAAPVEALADVADDIISRRDTSRRAPDSPLEEFSVVVKAFNSVLDESEARTRDLTESNQALLRQIEETVAAESALALATARLESTMAAAEIGSWVWNLQNGEVTLDRNLSALYGRDPSLPLKGDASLLHLPIHPDDLTRVKAAEFMALQTGYLASTEYRIVLPDGSMRWVVSRGTVHTDRANQPATLLGLLIDITPQRVAEFALRQSEKLYRAIGESIDYGVWVCDAEGRNIYASDSFLHLMGITQQQCSGMGWGDLLHPDEVEETIAAWQECVRTGNIWYREHRYRGADQRYHPVLAQGVPMRDEDGTITGWAGINLDISRMKETEDALREADRRKDDFLATLAHELRNPLAPIRHAARLLGLKGLDEAQSQSAREIISRQVARMALLLDDLLEVSRITRGRLELRPERVPLSAVVKAAVETSKPLLEQKKHMFTIDMPDTALELHVDPLRMSQALSNLLTNAAKYTDECGRVHLRIHATGHSLDFTVQDSGIGVPAAALPTIFEMFSQVDSAIDRSEGGLGIGLALVKGLISLHGGSVEAASDGPGCGSTFTIHLPAALVHGPPTETAAQPAPHGSATSGARGRILVVDDNRDAAASLAMVLRSTGHVVFTAHSGEQALKNGEIEEPDAVVLDIGMPEMNGYEVARRIRHSGWGKSALLVAVTGWGQKEDVERAMGAGFDLHMTKPADPERIEQLLEEFMHSRQKTGASGEK